MPARQGPLGGLDGHVDGWTLGTTYWDDDLEVRVSAVNYHVWQSKYSVARCFLSRISVLPCCSGLLQHRTLVAWQTVIPEFAVSCLWVAHVM